MSKLLTAVFLLLSFNAISQITKDQFKALKRELPADLNARWDKFDNVIWIITNKLDIGSSTSGIASLEYYFGVYENSIGPLRVRISFVSNDWLFIDEMTILCGTAKDIRQGVSERFNLTVPTEKVKRNTLGDGRIKEIVDFSPSYEVLQPILNCFAYSTNVMALRLSGEGGNFQSVSGFFGNKVNSYSQAIMEYYQRKR